MRNKYIVIAVILILCIALFLSKNFIICQVIKIGFKVIAGVNVQIKEVSTDLSEARIEIKDLKVFNPPGFEDAVMIDIPYLFLDYSLESFAKNRMIFSKVDLYLKEFIIVKNKEGKINFTSLKVLKDSPEHRKDIPVDIDVLNLKIDKVIGKDYSKGSTPVVKEFKINVDEEFKNISDFNTLAYLVVYKAMAGSPISVFMNYNINILKKGLQNTWGATSQIASTALSMGKEMENAAKGAVGILTRKKQVSPGEKFQEGQENNN